MPEFLQASIQVLLGIGLLFGGGELFVQGSVAMAVIFGIPQLVIGLTVVSLGTSAPELFVSLSSVLQGCLLYTSPSPRDVEESRMPSSA